MRNLCFCLLAAALVAAAFAQPGPSGHWEGTVVLPAGSTGPNIVTLDLASDGQGGWTASLGVPQQHASGLIVAALRVEGSKVKFNAPDVPGIALFDLTLAGDKLAGTISIKEVSLPVELKRTGEAKVEIVPASPAVLKEFEGDWEAVFTLGNGETRPVQVHFKNKEDRTVAATIDSPNQGFHGLLERVQQKGSGLKFQVRIYGGAFEGNLNAVGTEIAGNWVQSEGEPPVPLTFKRR